MRLELQEVYTLPQVATLVEEATSDELLDVQQVADRLGVDPIEVRRWAARGLLPSRKVAGRFVFSLSDVTRWQVQGLARLVESAKTDLLPEIFA